ncbi:unnamed protein product [Thlaspi arvense]|uniref:Homeobox domain-containing protein n=1 Tax=Thlaspi arvense TaxID=13288 RepID=A0AAU9RXB7_THLAR|nr:unnamed protein product [Thlaspi arvense]
MEPPQHHHHHQADQESGNNNKSGSGGYTCRQTSTRWTPTTEQIRILKELYYNNGVRSPTADQIQKISAMLRQHGKIEGKNVFYWFQNHKARNLNHASSGTECGAVNASNGYMSSHLYGSMEQDCSMNYNNNVGGGGWTNTDHNNHYSTPAYNFFERPKPLFGLEGHQEEGKYGGDAYLEHRRTLPLFPMHGEDHFSGGGGAIWKYGQSDDRDLCASLLCLNSYAGVAPD